MALDPYPVTKRIPLTATPLDLRAALSDDALSESGWPVLRYLVQGAGSGIQWTKASATPAATGPWHSLRSGANIILPIFEGGTLRPWFRATVNGAAIIVSAANEPAGA